MKHWIYSVCLFLAGLTCVIGADFADEAGGSAEMPTDPAAPDETTHNLIENEQDTIDADEGSKPAVVPDTSPKIRPVSFRVTVRATYDSNIYAVAQKPQKDFITSISPGVTIGAGDLTERKDSFISLHYDATGHLYADHSQLDSVDHNAALEGLWEGATLSLGGRLVFRDIMTTENEISGLINEKDYQAGVTATENLSEKTTLVEDLSGEISDYEKLLSTTETRLRLWGNYNLSLLSQLGVGVTLGKVEVSGGSTQTYEQMLARGNYRLGDKVGLRAEAGEELRQIANGGGSEATPVFSLEANYSPSDVLQLQLEGYRRVQPSITNTHANIVVTGVSAGVVQRFFERFELSVSGAYQHYDFQPFGAGAPLRRHDDYFLARVEQSYIFNEFSRLGVFYQYRTNLSTQAERSYLDQQMGVEFTLSF